jgi:ribosomal protein L37AE/L43A
MIRSMTTAGPSPEQMPAYDGPNCPRCHARLTADWIRTGIVQCPDCNRRFEATAFTPVARRLRVAEVATAGPVEANACANHARNAAVTSCQRCGLLICALCDMNVGTGSYCPSCFDRLRSEGSDPVLATKRRDYRAMARVSTIVGFFPFAILGWLFGTLSLYYLSKARKQLVARGESAWPPGIIVIMLFDIVEIFFGLVMIGVVIAAAVGALK